MKKYFIILLLLVFLKGFSQQFPATKKTGATISKFQTTYVDDYTWLENMGSAEVQQWAKAQNDMVTDHLNTVRKTYSSAAKIKEYDHYSSNQLPKKKGKYFYSIYIKDDKRAPALYYRKKLNDMPLEVANPYKIYKNENAYITNYTPSKNSTFIALQMSHNGSDKTEVRFANVDKLAVSDEMLTGINSNIAWNMDSGIFYKKNSNQRTFDKDSTFQLFYHKIGTPQAQDQLIFDTTLTENQFSFTTTENKLLINESAKNGIRNYYSASLLSDQIVPVKYVSDDDSGFTFLTYHAGRVYFSRKDYDWGEISSFDINNRAEEKTVIPQLYNNLLVDSFYYEDYIICKYRASGNNYMIVYDADGTFVRRFDVPAGMDFTVKFLDRESKQLFVSFYSRTISFLNYTLNLETGKANPYFNDFVPPKPTLFPFDHFETVIKTYKSRDNQDVPITIIYKKGLALDGKNPLLLKAYGGYGSVSGPSYSTGLLYFLERGGVFAFAEIRGGGEKGLKWHESGKGLKKKNAFNDFIDGAEFLIAEKYTSASKLAITGTSHGGLVVGAAMTMRPELFKVVIARMGAYDMVQYGKYTVGERNYHEYGNPEKEEYYKYLLSYSPYQNIKDDVDYPVTLIVTGENDDRVPPVHSYKFAARLQNRSTQRNPIYLQTNSNSGHSGNIATYGGMLNEDADFYNFLLYHLAQ